MVAMLRFKKETGREVTEMKGDSLTDICTYLWCCVKSAYSVEGKQFDLPLIDFADRIDQSDLVPWSSMVMGQDEWERMRIAATIGIQPHVRRKFTPQKLLPFPWDSKNKAATQKTTAENMSSEDRRRRFEGLLSLK